MPKLRVVLDTNVVLRAISSKSNLAKLLDKLYSEEYEAVVSTEIILEYEEKITHFYGQTIAKTFLEFLIILPNTLRIEPFFQLNLITNDVDDNKFVDCAFSANAHYIVTDDKHFKVLKDIDFPTIPVINAEDFKILLNKL
ncbi:PIN domain-containing protein [Emticicia aquatilis]|uniref:PIN domain-containing protein n=1 Tax=Emticicia aquatilis TaxID=1537369 RepID=A0A916YGX3_9BACT|nr:putative toxin-antitoxin system toxin component, PIN family [Emticicia aquatilis]GGD42963.1 PIN domain-containing protein [Emticicia aquatilis]